MKLKFAFALALLAFSMTVSARPPLRVYGSTDARHRPGTAGAKLDPALADLASHLSQGTPGTGLTDLHSLSPAAKFMQRAPGTTSLVLVDAVTRGDPRQLRNVLVALGLQGASVYSNDVSGWLPVDQIDPATTHAELHSMRAAMSRTRSGAVTTQGDFAQRSAMLRNTYPTLDGTGVTIGVLSDSYDCYPVYAQNHVPASGPTGYAPNGFLATASNDVTTGDLPSGVSVMKEADCMNYGAP